MSITNKDLKRRIISLSYKHKLSHLGSCLTALDIIEKIYAQKEPNDLFILSSGHAGLALYVVLEKYYNFINAEELFKKHGVHPNRDLLNYIDCSTGSLGQGLPIAVGIALADRNKNVYCLVSDGEMNEGSCYEALEIAHEQKLSNLRLWVNCNGWGAYKELIRDHIVDRCIGFRNVNINFVDTTRVVYGSMIDIEFPFLKGQDAHYYTMTEEDYKLAIKLLE